MDRLCAVYSGVGQSRALVRDALRALNAAIGEPGSEARGVWTGAAPANGIVSVAATSEFYRLWSWLQVRASQRASGGGRGGGARSQAGRPGWGGRTRYRCFPASTPPLLPPPPHNLPLTPSLAQFVVCIPPGAAAPEAASAADPAAAAAPPALCDGLPVTDLL